MESPPGASERLGARVGASPSWPSHGQEAASLPKRPHQRTSSTVFLAHTVRRNDSDFASTEELVLHHAGPPRLLDIPKFSTVSLTTVWGLSVLSSALCYVLAEVYQESHFTHEFPLGFVAFFACHLNILASFAVYFLGRQKHGGEVYRFYQPFAGGQRFVVVQSFGVFALAVSSVCTAAYMQTLKAVEDTRHGVFLTIAVLAVVGDVAVYLSPRYFDRSQADHRAASAGASSAEEPGKPAPVFSFSALLGMLRRSPNTETALICALASAQILVSWAANCFRAISFSSTTLVLAIQVCIGLLLHVFIGCRTKPGYCLVMLRLPRHIDTLGFWLCWAQYWASLIADVLCLRHFLTDEVMPSTFYSGVLGFNTYATLSLLLFIRTTVFRKRHFTAPSTVFEYGGLAAAFFGAATAAFSVGVITYLQIHGKELSGSAEGRSHERLLRIGSYLCQGFSLLLSPVIQAMGKVMHGDGFSIVRPYHGHPAFLLIQGYGWLSYTSAVLCTVLYVVTKNELTGTLAAVMASLSSLSLVFSLREYSSVKLFAIAKERGEAQGDLQGCVDPFAVLSRWTSCGTAADSQRQSSPTLADVIMASRMTPKPTATSPPRQQQQQQHPQEQPAGHAVSWGEPGGDGGVGLAYMLNGEMILAYIFAICNVVIRFIVDVSVRRKQDTGAGDMPIVNLIAVAHGLFVVTVPLAYVSGRDKGIPLLRPFSGSGTYVALQVLTWAIYLSFLVALVISGILTFHHRMALTEWIPALGGNSYMCTMMGLLQVIPLVLVTVSIAHESTTYADRRRRRVLAKESFELIRSVLREYVASSETPDEKAVMQLAFTTLMEPALQTHDISFSRKMMRLYLPDQQRRTRRDREDEGSEASSGSDSAKEMEAEAFGEMRSAGKGLPPLHRSEFDDSDSADDALEEQREQRHRIHQGARVVVVLMSCSVATLFVVASFFAHVTVFALACAVCGLLLDTVCCIGIHVGYGMLLHGKTGTFAVFMPFKGGSAFVNRQVVGWFSFALTFLIVLVTTVEERGVGSHTMAVAAVLSVVSQVFLLESIPRFRAAPERQPSFVEQNGEGVVAVLAFAGAIPFAYVYDRLHLFFYGIGAEGPHSSSSSSSPSSSSSVFAMRLDLPSMKAMLRRDWTNAFGGVFTDVSRRSKVPFVLALLSLLVALPFVLIAMARTTQQWEKLARQARRELRRQRASVSASGSFSLPEDSITRSSGSESPKGATSRHRRHADGSLRVEGGKAQRQRGLERGMWAVALTNFLETATILFGAVAPFTLLFLVYSVSHNYSPWVFDTVMSFLPSVFLVTLVVLVFSVVSHFANVGVPQFVLSLRICIVTYCLYGMPVLVATILIGPAFFFPCIGTRYSAVATASLTILGSYKQVRRFTKYGVFALVGYSTYQLYITLAAHARGRGEGGLVFSAVARALLGYVVNCIFLLFWVWYLPLYHGRPELSGVQRNLAFTNFLRQYIWEDAVRYFNFKVIVDDSAVNMRDEKNQFLFSFHPHGVFPGTALFCSITKEWMHKVGLNHKCYVSTHEASIIFNVPLIRDFNLRQGALSVSRRGLEASLSRGNSVMIVTGGQAEMLHTSISDKVMTLVTQHSGFIRIAVRNKVPIVPLLCFGEQNILGLVQCRPIQKVMLKLLGFPFPMFPYGVFGLPLPRKARLSLVVGKPLTIPEGADAEDNELIQSLAKEYFCAVQELFYRRREEAGYPEMELVLVNDKEEAAKRRAAAAAAKAASKQKTKQEKAE